MTSQTRNDRLVQHTPIFYGWIIWLVAMIGLSATSPGQSYSVSLFIDHYIVDFNIDRTTVSGLYGIGTFIAAFSLTWVGKWIDQYGNRTMAIIIAAAFALVLLANSLVTGPLTLVLSFVAIRALGQGAMGLVSTTLIAQWFSKRRGLMMGLAAVGFAVVQRFYLPFLQGFIAEYGWRTAWLMLGAGIGLIILPLLTIFFRDRPEDFGLLPDNADIPSELDDDEPEVLHEVNWELNEALRTPILWAFTAARMLAGAWGTALIFHQISIFEELGFSASTAATTYGRAALMTAAFTIVAGWLVDRLRPHYLIVIHMAGLIGISALALVMRTPQLLILYTIFYGVFMGVGGVFDNTVWVNMFGREHQGAIRGFVATANVIGTSLGPIVFGFIFDQSGTYDLALWIGIGLAVIASVAALLVKMPTRRKKKSLQ